MIYELTGPNDKNELQDIWCKMELFKGIFVELAKTQDPTLPGLKYKVLVRNLGDIPPSYVKMIRVPESWVTPRPDVRYMDIADTGWVASRQTNGKIHIRKYGESDE